MMKDTIFINNGITLFYNKIFIYTNTKMCRNKKCRPIDDNESGLNNRDPTPAVNYTTNDLNVFDSICIYFIPEPPPFGRLCSSI